MSSDADFIVPDWPAPARVRALSTTRTGGVSTPPWDSFNLGGHVADHPDHVEKNRQRLAGYLGVPPAGFCFLDQVHGTNIVELPQRPGAVADGCVTSRAGVPCLVMAADCLPVLFCDRAGTRVAAAHAGWRGLCEGVLERAAAQFDHAPDVLAWLGPAIGPGQFEVGAEVRDAFVQQSTEAVSAFIPSSNPGHFLADLYRLARQRLASAGVTRVYGGHWCTFSDAGRFFSFRRDGVTGRMASLILLE